MKLKELIDFKSILPQGASGIISENIILLEYSDDGVISRGTLKDHNIHYESYRIVNYDKAHEGFLFITEER